MAGILPGSEHINMNTKQSFPLEDLSLADGCSRARNGNRTTDQRGVGRRRSTLLPERASAGPIQACAQDAVPVLQPRPPGSCSSSRHPVCVPVSKKREGHGAFSS